MGGINHHLRKHPYEVNCCDYDQQHQQPCQLWMILMTVFESHLRMLTDLNSVSKNNDGFKKKSAGFQGLMFKWTMLAFSGDSRLISKMPPEWQATRWRNCYRDSLEQFSGMPGHGDVRSKDGCMEQICREISPWISRKPTIHPHCRPILRLPIHGNGRFDYLQNFKKCHPNRKFQNHPKKILFY